jgi:hypothetical protein
MRRQERRARDAGIASALCQRAATSVLDSGGVACSPGQE